jgi:hypothetical protein
MYMQKEKNFFDSDATFKISGNQISIINFLTRKKEFSQEDGNHIREILRKVVAGQEPAPSVSIVVDLGGNAVCGDPSKPDSCLACSGLSRCVLDNFNENVSRIRDKKQAPIQIGS